MSRQGGVKNKNTRVKSGKPPAPGERKAMRKRVVLSNTNALEVQGMQAPTAENMVNPSIQNQMLGLDNDLVDSLRAIEAFKSTQGWNLFRRPATLIRKETLDMAKHIDAVAGAEKPETVRKVLYGPRGSGKSVLLLQAKAMALLKGWLVVHIPEGNQKNTLFV